MISQAAASRQFILSKLGEGFEDIDMDNYEDQIAAGNGEAKWYDWEREEEENSVRFVWPVSLLYLLWAFVL